MPTHAIRQNSVFRELGEEASSGGRRVVLTGTDAYTRLVSVPAGESVGFNLEFPKVQIVSFWVNATKPMTLRWNGSTPTSVTLLEDVPYAWNTSSYFANPVQTDVTSITVTNNGAVAAKVRFELLLNVQAVETGDTEPPTRSNNSAATCNNGATVVVSSSRLLYSDNVDPPSGVVYTITAGPSSGQFESSLAPTTPITTWTQKTINDGQLVYRHDGSATPSDSITFDVADLTANALTGETFSLVIPVDAQQADLTSSNQLATVTLDELSVTVQQTSMTASNQLATVTRADDVTPPTQQANTGVSLLELTSKTIGPNELRFFDEVSQPPNVTYNITAGPSLGVVEKATVQPNVATRSFFRVAVNTFTQADVDAGLISYRHTSAATGPDSFNFTVQDEGFRETPPNVPNVTSSKTFNVTVNAQPGGEGDPSDLLDYDLLFHHQANVEGWGVNNSTEANVNVLNDLSSAAGDLRPRLQGRALVADGNCFAKTSGQILSGGSTAQGGMSCWCKFPSHTFTSGQRQPIIGQYKSSDGPSGDGRMMGIECHEGHLAFCASTNGTGDAVRYRTNIKIDDGQWHHLAASWHMLGDKAIILLFVDGRLETHDYQTEWWDRSLNPLPTLAIHEPASPVPFRIRPFGDTATFHIFGVHCQTRRYTGDEAYHLGWRDTSDGNWQPFNRRRQPGSAHDLQRVVGNPGEAEADADAQARIDDFLDDCAGYWWLQEGAGSVALDNSYDSAGNPNGNTLTPDSGSWSWTTQDVDSPPNNFGWRNAQAGQDFDDASQTNAIAAGVVIPYDPRTGKFASYSAGGVQYTSSATNQFTGRAPYGPVVTGAGLDGSGNLLSSTTLTFPNVPALGPNAGYQFTFTGQQNTKRWPVLWRTNGSLILIAGPETTTSEALGDGSTAASGLIPYLGGSQSSNFDQLRANVNLLNPQFGANNATTVQSNTTWIMKPGKHQRYFSVVGTFAWILGCDGAAMDGNHSGNGTYAEAIGGTSLGDRLYLSVPVIEEYRDDTNNNNERDSAIRLFNQPAPVNQNTGLHTNSGNLQRPEYCVVDSTTVQNVGAQGMYIGDYGIVRDCTIKNTQGVGLQFGITGHDVTVNSAVKEPTAIRVKCIDCTNLDDGGGHGGSYKWTGFTRGYLYRCTSDNPKAGHFWWDNGCDVVMVNCRGSGLRSTSRPMHGVFLETSGDNTLQNVPHGQIGNISPLLYVGSIETRLYDVQQNLIMLDCRIEGTPKYTGSIGMNQVQPACLLCSDSVDVECFYCTFENCANSQFTIRDNLPATGSGAYHGNGVTKNNGTLRVRCWQNVIHLNGPKFNGLVRYAARSNGSGRVNQATSLVGQRNGFDNNTIHLYGNDNTSDIICFTENGQWDDSFSKWGTKATNDGPFNGDVNSTITTGN